MARQWVKLWTDILFDFTFRSLSCDGRLTFVMLIAFAGKLDEAGALSYHGEPLRLREITDATGLKPKRQTAAIEELVKTGFLQRNGEVLSLTHWGKYQAVMPESTYRDSLAAALRSGNVIVYGERADEVKAEFRLGNQRADLFISLPSGPVVVEIKTRSAGRADADQLSSYVDLYESHHALRPRGILLAPRLMRGCADRLPDGCVAVEVPLDSGQLNGELTANCRHAAAKLPTNGHARSRDQETEQDRDQDQEYSALKSGGEAKSPPSRSRPQERYDEEFYATQVRGFGESRLFELTPDQRRSVARLFAYKFSNCRSAQMVETKAAGIAKTLVAIGESKEFNSLRVVDYIGYTKQAWLMTRTPSQKERGVDAAPTNDPWLFKGVVVMR